MKLPLFALSFGLIASLGFSATTPAEPVGGTAKWMTQIGAVRAAPVRVSPSSIVQEIVMPRYPYEMRQLGMPGYVKLDVAIDAQGNVLDALVLEANDKVFAREAVRAVGKWRFYPASEDEAGIVRIVRVPMEFALVALR